MDNRYNHKEIEKKWQKYWEKHPDLFSADDKSSKEKKYILDMFPYPSGAGLHAGHVESYTATDIISRYYRMKGFNVIHPQGWDAFGLPAENYAIKTKIHPTETTKNAIKTFKKQMAILGFSYDWSREVNSSDPEYYKWTQWFFLLLYKNGLAYKKKAKVNWCENCMTVLANEQAEGGICERCKNKVEQKELEQWFFKITDFIEDDKKTSGLISGLDKVDWPESTKQAQRNWIGKSEGAIIQFSISNYQLSIEVFTTRVDTIFGCTYVVVAPEHPFVASLLKIKNQKLKIKNIKEVEKYIEKAKNKTELERMETKEKTGVELKGIKAVNPFNNEEVPIFIADYVLGHYGTGAVMAVPAHDERDFEFAKKNNLPIKQSIKAPLIKGVGGFKSSNNPPIPPYQGGDLDKAFTEDGIVINSGEFTGLTSEEAREKMVRWLEGNKIGKKKINYKLRDWLVSRQRYWGAPIPIIYCEECGEVPVLEKDLPVELPTDVDFRPTGESPLKYSKKFHSVKCPKCGKKARRESDTMDTFVCSSWYYFRYADPKNKKAFAEKEKIKKWLPVDLYLGGAEHTVLHLLYSRFFTKVLHKLGHIDFDEPFLKLRHQGIILGEDNRKMSKSLGNVVNPDQYVKEFGADSLRMYEMFMGPLEDMKPWSAKGIVGVKRFLDKTWDYLFNPITGSFPLWANNKTSFNKELFKQWINSEFKPNPSREIKTSLNKTIKKVTEDIENFKFNTVISQLMILRNEFYKEELKEYIMPGFMVEPIRGRIIEKLDFEKFLLLLAPFAPHFVEEIWSIFGEFSNDKKYKESIFKQGWPKPEEKYLKDETIKLVVQINSKVRDTIEVSADISENEAKKIALESEKVKKWIGDSEVKKVIYIKGRLINIVI